jgi:hypothetical protein
VRKRKGKNSTARQKRDGAPLPSRVSRPDVLARLRRIYGDKVMKVSNAELLAWERDRY